METIPSDILVEYEEDKNGEETDLTLFDLMYEYILLGRVDIDAWPSITLPNQLMANEYKDFYHPMPGFLKNDENKT